MRRTSALIVVLIIIIFLISTATGYFYVALNSNQVGEWPLTNLLVNWGARRSQPETPKQLACDQEIDVSGVTVCLIDQSSQFDVSLNRLDILADYLDKIGYPQGLYQRLNLIITDETLSTFKRLHPDTDQVLVSLDVEQDVGIQTIRFQISPEFYDLREGDVSGMMESYVYAFLKLSTNNRLNFRQVYDSVVYEDQANTDVMPFWEIEKQ